MGQGQEYSRVTLSDRIESAGLMKRVALGVMGVFMGPVAIISPQLRSATFGVAFRGHQEQTIIVDKRGLVPQVPHEQDPIVDEDHSGIITS